MDLLPFHKLLTGGFRIGVSRGNLCKALAEVGGVEPAVIAQRISGEWDPRTKNFLKSWARMVKRMPGVVPFPFCLASPLQEEPTDWARLENWWAEWKWDGIRCQFLNEQGTGDAMDPRDESAGESFPELLEMIAPTYQGN